MNADAVPQAFRVVPIASKLRSYGACGGAVRSGSENIFKIRAVPVGARLARDER